MATQNFQPGKAAAPACQVELSISCKSLKDRDAFSKSDPMAVLCIKEFNSPQFVELGRTEVVNNTLSPEFSKKFILDYRFEEVQRIKIEIYDVDSASAALHAHDFLGRMECTLGEIVGAQGGKIHRNLTGLPGKLGSVILSAEELGASKEIAQMQWKGVKLDKKDFLGKSDPFLQIYRINADGSTTLAYRSEHIDNTLNPVWKPFRIPVRLLCGDNMDRSIRFECYDWDSDGGQAHDLIGIFETTFRQLRSGANNPQTVFDLVNAKKKAKKGKDYKNSGQMHLTQFNVETEHSFIDYIRGGTQLHFSVAVDFTASNGQPNEPNSLHYIHPQYPNQYMIALKAVGEIIQDYDATKMFPALGFGAKLPPQGVVSHEFFLNFSQDPHCHGVPGILDAYRRALTSVQLYGPTNFTPVINHVARFAAGCRDGSHYFVLLIITDGVISDMENTMQAIISASSLPMSIIIVGVGNADFSAMEALDADKYSLQYGGRTAERDIVQFVPMRNYVTGGQFDLSQARLAKDVLAEVPQQVVGYMRRIGAKPRPPLQANIAEPAPTPTPTPDTTQTVPAGPNVPGGPGMPPANPAPYQGGPNPAPPQQGAAYPNQPGTYPGQPGTNPQYPAAPQGFQQPGVAPAYPAAPQNPAGPYAGAQGHQPAPGYPGAPQNPAGPYPGAPGPYPSGGQPYAYPGQQPAYPQNPGAPGYPGGHPQGQPMTGYPGYPPQNQPPYQQQPYYGAGR